MLTTIVAIALLQSLYTLGDEVVEPPQFREDGLVIQVHQKPDTCIDSVRQGDTVSIRHAGFYGEQQIDADGGQPLKLVVGARHVLEGMERAMIGQCLGETRIVTIPPEVLWKKKKGNIDL